MKKSLDFLDAQQVQWLLDKVPNTKHQVCLLLMLDAGLRVSETVSLRYQDFDFQEKVIQVQSLKKRGKTQHRTIPISDRLYQLLAQYIKTQKNTHQEAYLFPGKTTKHLTRKALNRLLERIQAKYPERFQKLHPHMLRHTFATQHLANGLQLADIKNMLGHENLATTAIYTHTPLQIFRKSVEKVTQKTDASLWVRMKNWFCPTSPTQINICATKTDFTVGRQTELQRMQELIQKNCNLMLLGPIGVGKSHLIQQIKPPGRKILYIDECTDIKRTLIQCLVYLYQNDKEAVFQLLYGAYDLSKLQQHLQRDSIPKLTQEIRQITTPKEYLLVIDHIDRIPARAVKAIESLKDHFTILTSAREVPLNKSSLLWNFEIMHLKPLSRIKSITLIQQQSQGIAVEDLEIYRNHIYEQTQGNPRAILELTDRYRKEPILTADTIRSIQHLGSKKEYDMSLWVIIILGGLTTLRYVAHETGNDRLRLIGGFALLLLITARYFFRLNKKKKTMS